MSDELDPLAAAGEPLDWAAGAGAVAPWVADGWAVGVAGTLALVLGTMLTLGETLALVLGTMLTLGEMLALVLGTMPAPALGEKLMLRLGATPETAPPLPHPVTEQAAKPIAAARSMPPAICRMPDPSTMRSNLSQDVA